MNKQRFLEIESLLHSYADWETIGNKPRPYCFEIEKDGQYLYYFGANHSRDIKDEQYQKLEEYWQSFKDKTKNHTKIVLVEGGVRKLWPDEKTAVIKDSEAGYITYLAAKDNIHIESPEPERDAERQFLLQKYSKDQIQYYYFVRIVPVWHRLPKESQTLDEFIKGYAKSLSNGARGEDWNEYDFSFENMKKIHYELFSTIFDENDKDFLRSLGNPTNEKTVINKVARDSSRFRDVYIVSKICDLWAEHKNIFVVFGLAHPIFQEPALRKLLS